MRRVGTRCSRRRCTFPKGVRKEPQWSPPKAQPPPNVACAWNRESRGQRELLTVYDSPGAKRLVGRTAIYADAFADG
jgi:hypothetical protein